MAAKSARKTVSVMSEIKKPQRYRLGAVPNGKLGNIKKT